MLRLAGSFLAALVLVSALVALGVARGFKPGPVPSALAFRVDSATPEEVAAALGQSQPGTTRDAPWRDGFVQLSFTVALDGRAEGVRVLGAVPSGVFETQAIEDLRSRRLVPVRVNGAMVAREQTHIVAFRYRPAAKPGQPLEIMAADSP